MHILALAIPSIGHNDDLPVVYTDYVQHSLARFHSISPPKKGFEISPDKEQIRHRKPSQLELKNLSPMMLLLFVVVWMAVVGGWYDRMKRKIPAECSIVVVVSMVDGN